MRLINSPIGNSPPMTHESSYAGSTRLKLKSSRTNKSRIEATLSFISVYVHQHVADQLLTVFNKEVDENPLLQFLGFQIV